MKDIRQWRCVLRDFEPPGWAMPDKVQRAMHRETWSSVEENCETSAVSWKSTDVLGPIRRVRFTTATLRQAKPRENKGPSLGIIQVKTSHQRSPYAVKFEDRSQEETERQERCATDVWMMPAASKMKPEDREFVVDVGASMHMVSKKDLNSAELETVKVSKYQTTVMTANSEVLWKEEATVFVWELDLFVTVMLLADTPAVLSLRKLCEDHGYNYHWTSDRKPHLIRKWQKNQLQFCELSTIRCPWLVDEFLYFIFTWFFNIFIEGSRYTNGASRISKKWEYEWWATRKLGAWIRRTKTPPKMTTTKRHGVTRCMKCPDGYRISGEVW